MPHNKTPVIIPLLVGLISTVFSSSATKNIQHTRVILCIDASGSMCRQYSPENCCVPGDGSGYCAMNDPDNIRTTGAHYFVDSLRACDPESQVGVLTFTSSVSSRLAPLVLNNSDNTSRIHEAIDRAACGAAFSTGSESEQSVVSGQSLSKKVR